MPDPLTTERHPDATTTLATLDGRRAATDRRVSTDCRKHRRFVHATYGNGKAALTGRPGEVKWCEDMQGWHIYPEGTQ